jgi:hypothetical protein
MGHQDQYQPKLPTESIKPQLDPQWSRLGHQDTRLPLQPIWMNISFFEPSPNLTSWLDSDRKGIEKKTLDTITRVD